MVAKRASPVALFVLLMPGHLLLGASPPLPAFPGAEGFGAVATGGRGGRVIKVTTLDAKGPGSLLAAVQAKGPRIVVFDTSGIIRGNVTITEPDLTIAGQTAPGAGITIEGMLLTRYRIDPPVSNVVIRFLRVRPRPVRGKSVSGDCLQLTRTDRLIIDHVSCSWGSDENVDLCGSSNVTVQWCAIEESDPVGHVKGQHNYGMIVAYAPSRDITIHHNLFAHHQKRAPLIGCELVDHRNNLLYNFLLPFIFHGMENNPSRPGRPYRMNLVANTFKSGPNVHRHMKGRAFDKLLYNRPNVHLYDRGNACSWIEGEATSATQPRAAKPWPAPPVGTQNANDACELVLARAGCFPRDAVSKRMVEEVRNGAGSWGRHEPEGGLMARLTPGKTPRDADNDGMPDAWETAHGLNPADPADVGGTVPAGASAGDRHKGYTWIEFYINERADELVARAVEDRG